jgi:hypothetical protein
MMDATFDDLPFMRACHSLVVQTSGVKTGGYGRRIKRHNA